jgi:2-polyprenyl-3-methyl-5-hydroxy-6-metoxy-1,4-benzoquinol methylase
MKMLDASERQSHYAGYYDAVAPLSPLTTVRLDAWARWLLPYKKTGRLLEVGCGAGHFLAAAQRAGFEAWGTEISQSGLVRLKEQGFHVLAGALPELALPSHHFDAVVLFEVLEHLEDPQAYLVECRRILRAGGVVLLTTPNFGSLSQRLLAERWRVVDPEHLVLFTKQGLRHVLKRTGFKPIALGSRNVDLGELVRGLRREPRPQGLDRQARLDACRETLASRASLRLARDLANGILRLLSLGDTLEARAES